MGHRAMCVCGDADVRRIVADALVAAGLTVEHRPEVGAVDPGGRSESGHLDAGPADFAVIVVDRDARQAAGETLRGTAAPVIVVGDDLGDQGLISLMLESQVSHLVGDPGDRDLGITSEKLVTGDLFGLEKYVSGGTQVHERAVATEADKHAAIDEVCAWAEGIGARRPVLHRLTSVVDELLMNALLDAPRLITSSASPNLLVGARALLRWAADDHAIAVSVSDDYGALSQRDVIDHVLRARNERGRPRSEAVGAGLGLYFVISNVTSLIVNIDPGRRTEVVCLFDVSRRERRAVTSSVRSLHVFAASA